MTTEPTTINLPPCPLPDCEGGDHHYHDVDAYTIKGGHDCARASSIGYRCYGPHRHPQWQPIEHDQIKAGMRIRATVQQGDRATTHVGVAHHQAAGSRYWCTEERWPLDGWGDSSTYEVDLATIPDPDAELIDALREASWRIEHMGGRPDPLPGLPEARDLLNKLRELGWTVIRKSEKEQA